MKRVLLLSVLFVFAIVFATFAQRTVSGRVTDDVGESLPGVNVVVKGTTQGTTTDFDGNYRVSVDEGTVLVFSFVGFETQEVAVGSRTVIDLSMGGLTELQEIIVVAYGEQTKQSITGSIAQLSGEEIVKVPASNVVQGLVGRVSGVQVINQNGQPGAAPSVRFRGIGSINASNEPLYVVDGIPFNGNVNSISSHDIESITFLKDASANALYGSRGANGVILITTKRGNKGFEVTFDAKTGVSDRAVSEYNVITDPAEFYEAWYDRVRIGLIAGGMAPNEAATEVANNLISGEAYSLKYNNYDVAGNQVLDPNTGRVNPSANLLYHDDWQEELFGRDAIRQEYHLGIRSKKDRVGSYFSLGYLDDEGYALNSGFQRFTSRFTLDYDYTDWLSVGGNFNYASTDQDAPIQNVGSATFSNAFGWARGVAPIYSVYGYDANGAPLFDADGNRVWDFGAGRNGIPQTRPYAPEINPVATSIEDIDENRLENFSARLYGKVSFLKDFQFTYNLSLDNSNANITAFATPIGGDALGPNGRLTTTATKNRTLAHQQLLNWGKDFNNHNLSVLIGHESNNNEFELLNAQRTDFAVDNLPVLDNGAIFQGLRGYNREYNVEGFFSRVNYDYKGKFFLNASFRRDGSSIFHPDNRWGNFYGIGGAWLVSEESFFAGVSNIFSSLKLKASYGQQGNDALLYSFTRNITGDASNRNFHVHLNQLEVEGGANLSITNYEFGNPDLQWEISTNINAGFETSLLNNRIRLDAQYFVREVDDLLFNLPLPNSSSGGLVLPSNVGDMQNKGFEIDLTADIVDKGDWGYTFSFNATTFDNEVTRLPDEAIDDPFNPRFRLVEGKSRFDYYFRQYAGIDKTNGDALWYMDELDDDDEPTGKRVTTNEWNDATEYFAGKSAIPDWYGGFFHTVSYKGLTLDVGFAYQIGGYGYDGVYQGGLQSAPFAPGQNYHRDVFDSWTPENPTASLPRIDHLDDDQTNTSDFWLIDASYLSLQNVNLSYQLPSNWIERIGLTSAQVYAVANNVKLWSKRDGYDPRLSTIGNAVNEFSVVRSYSLGVNLKL